MMDYDEVYENDENDDFSDISVGIINNGNMIRFIGENCSFFINGKFYEIIKVTHDGAWVRPEKGALIFLYYKTLDINFRK